MTGCGGGGGGSSDDMPGDGNGGGGTPPPAMCSEGQTGTPPDCVSPPTDEERAQARAAAEKVAGMIGPGADLASVSGDATAVPPIAATPTAGTPVDPDTNNTSIVYLSTSASGVTTPQFVGDTQGPPVNVFVKSSDMPATIGDLEGGIYTRTDTATGNIKTSNTVVKYKDMAPNTGQAYSTYFGDAAATNANATHGANTAVSAMSNGALVINSAQIAGNQGLFEGDFGLTAGAGSQILTRTDEDTTTGLDESKFEVAGSFRGVPGTFSCSDPGGTTGCTVTSNAMGQLTGLTGGGSATPWTFTPAAITALGTSPTPAQITQALTTLMVPGVIQAEDFMIFGYWIQEVRAADGVTVTSERMSPFADGKRDPVTLAGVTGSASYTGSATGLYMSKGLTAGNLPTDPFNSGQFMASVMLKAYFADDTNDDIPSNKANTVSGSINNFRDASGNAIDSRWTLTLSGMNSTTDPDTFSGTAISADSAIAGAIGMFSGQYHGAADTTPVSASGTFDGHFTNGHVRGAFGVD